MKNPKKVAKELSKIFVNLGQGVILATVLSRLIQQQLSIEESAIVLFVGILTAGFGLYILSEYTEKEE